jgi:putative protease
MLDEGRIPKNHAHIAALGTLDETSAALGLARALTQNPENAKILKEIQRGIDELKKVYNKGFSSGFLIKMPTADDFSRAENSSAAQRKEFIGEVTHYFPNKQVAAVKICSGKLGVGDEILAISNKTGVIKSRVERIEINRKPVNSAKKGQEIGLKIPGARKKDKIYLVVKK